MAAAPAVGELGQGEAVIRLHCSASGGGQWRVLMTDLRGYGKGAPRDRLPDLNLAGQAAAA